MAQTPSFSNLCILSRGTSASEHAVMWQKLFSSLISVRSRRMLLPGKFTVVLKDTKACMAENITCLAIVSGKNYLLSGIGVLIKVCQE